MSKLLVTEASIKFGDTGQITVNFKNEEVMITLEGTISFESFNEMVNELNVLRADAVAQLQKKEKE